MYHLSFFGNTYITLKAHNSKRFRSRITPKCVLKFCAFYHAYPAVFMLISAPFGETMMSSYALIPQSLGIPTRGRLNFAPTSVSPPMQFCENSHAGGAGLWARRYWRFDRPSWNNTVQMWTFTGANHIKFTILRLAKLSQDCAKV